MKKLAGKSEKYKRPSWDEYFLDIVDAVSLRATCDRGGRGCVITRDNRILSTGYLGSASGLPHCSDVGHDGKVGSYCARTIHSEHNAMKQALNSDISLNGATMYCEVAPCEACAKMANSLGIKKIICKK